MTSCTYAWLRCRVTPTDYSQSNTLQVKEDGKWYAEGKTNVSVEDVINKLGSRVPDYTASQKNFRIRTLVLTDDNLTNEEWSYFSGQAKSFQDKFSWATGNRATATLGELDSIVK